MAAQWLTKGVAIECTVQSPTGKYIDLYSDIFNCSYYNASPPSQGQSFHTRAEFIEYMLFIDARARQKVKVEIYTGIYLQTLCQCLDCFGNIVSCCYQRSGGLVVSSCASCAEDPGFDSRCMYFFQGLGLDFFLCYLQGLLLGLQNNWQ